MQDVYLVQKYLCDHFLTFRVRFLQVVTQCIPLPQCSTFHSSHSPLFLFACRSACRCFCSRLSSCSIKRFRLTLTFVLAAVGYFASNHKIHFNKNSLVCSVCSNTSCPFSKRMTNVGFGIVSLSFTNPLDSTSLGWEKTAMPPSKSKRCSFKRSHRSPCSSQ